jgi:hypothetical protein
MTLERCLFSKITTTPWSGRSTTSPFLVGGPRLHRGLLRGSLASRWPSSTEPPATGGHHVAMLGSTSGVAADGGAAAMQAESPISSIVATGLPIHRGGLPL